MEFGYPVYPVDCLYFNLILKDFTPRSDYSGGLIVDIVRENLFGTAFDKSRVGKTNVHTL